jgi:hypothetical protein
MHPGDLHRHPAVMAVGGGASGWALAEFVVGGASNDPSALLTIPVALLSALAAAALGYGRRERPVTHVEPESVEEPLDRCGHDAKAEPVAVNIGGEEHVLGWLCVQCGAKVSPRAAEWRNREPVDLDDDSEEGLKIALRDRVDRLEHMTSGWEIGADGFVLTRDQHAAYVRACNEAERIKALIVASADEVKALESRRRMMVAADGRSSATGDAGDRAVTVFYQSTPPEGASAGDLWYDTNDDNTLRRRTGGYWPTWERVEETSIYSHASAAPTRRILS